MQSKVWADGSSDNLQKNINKGRRLTIAYAGNGTGVIPNVLLIFKSGINLEVTQMTWIPKIMRIDKKNQQIPILSVLVTDNTSYLV